MRDSLLQLRSNPESSVRARSTTHDHDRPYCQMLLCFSLVNSKFSTTQKQNKPTLGVPIRATLNTLNFPANQTTSLASEQLSPLLRIHSALNPMHRFAVDNLLFPAAKLDDLSPANCGLRNHAGLADLIDDTRPKHTSVFIEHREIVAVLQSPKSPFTSSNRPACRNHPREQPTSDFSSGLAIQGTETVDLLTVQTAHNSFVTRARNSQRHLQILTP